REKHPGGGDRVGPGRRGDRAADLLPDDPADGEPADLGARGHARRERHQALRPHLRHDRRRTRQSQPRDRLHDVPAGFPSRAVRLRIRGGGRHARRTDSDHDLQRSTLPDRLGHVTVLAESMAGSRPRTPAGRLVAIAFLLMPVQVAFLPLLTTATSVVPDLQLTRGYVAVWLAHTAFALPFGIFLLRNFFITLPPDMIEAARMDGASDFRVFSRIVLPVSVPAIAAYGIFQFLWVWNDLLMALVFVQDSSKFPMTRAIQNLLSQYGTEWHLLAAGAFLLMIVPLIVFFSLQRYFVQGLLAGS